MSDTPNVPHRRVRLPDKDTKQAVLYGSSYSTAKILTLGIDHELRILDRMIAAEWEKIDLDNVRKILDDYPHAPYTEKTVSTILTPADINLADTVYALREIVRSQWAQAWLSDRRVRIHKTARVKGSIERSLKIGDNYSEDLWRSSARIDDLDDVGVL